MTLVSYRTRSRSTSVGNRVVGIQIEQIFRRRLRIHLHQIVDDAFRREHQPHAVALRIVVCRIKSKNRARTLTQGHIGSSRPHKVRTRHNGHTLPVIECTPRRGKRLAPLARLARRNRKRVVTYGRSAKRAMHGALSRLRSLRISDRCADNTSGRRDSSRSPDQCTSFQNSCLSSHARKVKNARYRITHTPVASRASAAGSPA